MIRFNRRTALLALLVATFIPLAACESLKGALQELNPPASSPPPVYRRVQDTPLYDLFLGHENKGWPHVALTVIHVPDWGASVVPPVLTPRYPSDSGCFEVSARIWRDTAHHEDVDPFFLCPQDVVQDVPFMGVVYADIPAPGDATTGSVRTLGPTPADHIFPHDPESMRLFGGITPTSQNGQLYLVGSLMIAMHYDWNSETHLRVWIAQYVEAHSSYYRER